MLPSEMNPDLLVGLETRDDAGIYRISENLALVQTIDFFTPIVDDPNDFGQIAVANSLSDIYAMGGVPKTALNVLGYPSDIIDRATVIEILKGGYTKAKEAGVIILGGHSVKDPELKFGMAVTGVIHPDEIVHNSGAKPGDALILTKPLGTGILTTALKNENLPDDILHIVTQKMKQLNKTASELMKEHGANACTDITGYGLLGHLSEMAEASDVSAKIFSANIPLFPGAMDFSQRKQLPGGLLENQNYLRKYIRQQTHIGENLLNILFDPQTSGGLLISISGDKADDLLNKLKKNGYPESAIIGEVMPKTDVRLKID